MVETKPANRQISMTKELLTLDIESTGLNPATDRIITLALTSQFEEHEWMLNPGVEISEEIQNLTGITNEAVRGCPEFKAHAAEIHDIVSKSDLLGFNLLNFDVVILWEEFYRAGIEWDLSKTLIIDSGNIFKKKEERSLSAGVRFYCNREHIGAHGAKADCLATQDVFSAQLERYPDLGAMDRAKLAEFSRFDDRLTLDGKIVKGPDGSPTYNFGKNKGVRVKDDLGFAYWILGRDFPTQTRMVLRKIVNQYEGVLLEDNHS